MQGGSWFLEALVVISEVAVFAAIAWLAFGFIGWVALAVATAIFRRRHHDSTSELASGHRWKPGLASADGLAATAVYVSVALLPLGLITMVGWQIVGDDRFGLFTGMTLVAVGLTDFLVYVFVRLAVLARRGELSAGSSVWIAYVTTFLGQLIALAVVVRIGLMHAPGFFGS